MRGFILCLLLPLTLALSACQPSSGGDKNGANKGQGQQKSAVEVVFPDAFPAYIPKYPGARPMNGANLNVQGQVSGAMGQSQTMFVTTDSREKVIAFYKTELLKAGLIERTVQSLPIMEMSVYSKEETPDDTVMVMINKMLPGDTFVQIMFQKFPDAPKN